MAVSLPVVAPMSSIAPALDRLPDSIVFIERDWLSCNQVLLFDDDGATLIDSGYASRSARTVELVTQALAGRPLKRVLNTHLHSDHCGGNAALVETFGCEVWIPHAEARAVAEWDVQALTFAATGQICPRFRADGVVSPGQVWRMGGLDWQVYAAPGHDPHSLILHNAECRLLMSADALWEQGFGIIFPELAGESGFAEQHAVLGLIAGLAVDWVIPGHGPVFGDVAAALERARARLAAMQADPRRNARNALKALMKFLMLDRKRMRWIDLRPLADTATLMRDAAGQLAMEPLAAIQIAVDDLAAQGLLRLEDGWLIDVTPVTTRH